MPRMKTKAASLGVRLPMELDDRLRHLAQSAGTSPNLYAQRILIGHLTQQFKDAPVAETVRMPGDLYSALVRSGLVTPVATDSSPERMVVKVEPDTPKSGDAIQEEPKPDVPLKHPAKSNHTHRPVKTWGNTSVCACGARRVNGTTTWIEEVDGGREV